MGLTVGFGLSFEDECSLSEKAQKHDEEVYHEAWLLKNGMDDEITI